jgi:hypothetical protein
MQLVAIVLIGIVVLVVAIDAIARLDERNPPRDRDEAIVTTQKIIVDLTKRR